MAKKSSGVAGAGSKVLEAVASAERGPNHLPDLDTETTLEGAVYGAVTFGSFWSVDIIIGKDLFNGAGHTGVEAAMAAIEKAGGKVL